MYDNQNNKMFDISYLIIIIFDNFKKINYEKLSKRTLL